MTGCQVTNNTELPKPSPTVTVSSNPSIVNTPTPIASASVISKPNTSEPTSILHAKQIKKVEIFSKKNSFLIDSSETINMEPKPFIRVNGYMDIKAVVTYNDGSETSDLLFKSSDKTLAIVENDRISTVENKSGTIKIIVLSKENNQEIFKSEDISIDSCPMGCNFVEAIMGKVYDDNGNPITDAKVTVKNVYPGHEINDTTLTDEYGYYKIRYIPSGELIEVTVSKEGYKAITRRVVLKYSGGKPVDMINFGSPKIDEKPFALIPDRNN